MDKYKKLLHDYYNGVALLETKLLDLSEAQLFYKPSPDTWNIKEHVIHIVDSEINNFIRWKSIIAQPKSKAYVIDEENWVKNFDCTKEDLTSYLMVFKLLRHITYRYLSTIEEFAWTDGYFIHEYNGKTTPITLEQTIEGYKEHIVFHIDYIDKLITAYENNA